MTGQTRRDRNRAEDAERERVRKQKWADTKRQSRRGDKRDTL